MSISEIIEYIRKGECTTIEFKRKPDIAGVAETICAMANTEGGVILIGVDNDGQIIGVSKDAIHKLYEAVSAIRPYPEIDISSVNIDNKVVLIIKVKKSDKIHSFRGVVYIRIGASNRPLSLEEILEKSAEVLLLRFDEMPSNASLDAIDLNLVKEYFEKREKIRRVKFRGSLEENMLKMRIVVRKNEKLVPTNAGILFFSKNPQLWIPHAKVHLVWFRDDEMREYSDIRFFDGPLWKIVDDIEEYFRRNLKIIGGELLGWKRTEIFEYPLRALREAVINALIHRNYFDPSEIKIFVTPNRIIIRNPGSFPPGVSPENPIHKPRNPLLAQYMFDIGYIEKYGYGIKMMKEECEKHPLVRIKFNIRPFVTEVIFEKIIKWKILDEIDKKIYELLKEKGSLTSGELAKLLSISKPTVLKHLKKLMGLGIVNEVGEGRAKRYQISVM